MQSEAPGHKMQIKSSGLGLIVECSCGKGLDDLLEMTLKHATGQC